MWYSSIDGSPGICDSALDIIRERAVSYLAKNHHPLHLSVMMDDMAIRKKLAFNIDSHNFEGFVTAGDLSGRGRIEQNETICKVAKEVSVIMAVGPDFKVPIAYHFINGLEAVDRARITLEAIRRIEETGAIVMNLTGDGHIVNISTSNMLGANYKDHQPYFYSPSHPDQKIYFILDPPHMLKLIRKQFSTQKLYHKDQLIDWNLLKMLVDRQETENFNLCNKLTRIHIDWYQKPMNVKLAAETISKSVADTLDQLNRDGYEEFENSRATTEFLLNFNNAFDILNFAEKNKTNSQYKQPISNESTEIIFSFAEKFKQYIEDLEVEVITKTKTWRKPILESRGERGFTGFYNNFISLRGIYDDFVKNGSLPAFFPFQFSQDHLESFFSLIRNSQGRNDNPSTIEFRSAFRKLLVCHPLITSVDHNVISNATGILTISSRNSKRSIPEDSAQEYELEAVDFSGLLQDECDDMDPYDHHMVAYVALCIEHKVIAKMNNCKNKYKCSQCINLLLNSNDKIHDELLAVRPDNSQPCESTVTIVIFANAVMKSISNQRSQGNNFNSVWKTIYNNLNIHDLYTYEDFEEHQHQLKQTYCHKEEFIIQLIKMYMTIKSQKIGNKITDEERGELIRNRRKHAVHHAGQ